MKQQTLPIGSTIRIQMLGGFSVYVDDTLIIAVESGGQIWNLMEYLVCYRKKTVTQEQLIDVLWDDDVEDPAAALKNLVYRLRKAFADAGVPFAKKVIVSSGGMYRFNNDLPCVVDVEEYEQAFGKAEQAANSAEKMELARAAAELYSGDFLPGACHRPWVTPINRYYHSMYFRGVYALMKQYEEASRWEDMLTVATRAAEIDRFEEKAHSYIMLSLLKTGRQSQAIDHYNYVSDLFYREMGADLSPQMRAMFSELAQTVKNYNINLASLKEDLKETTALGGAYYCEYEIFKGMYRVKARSAQRDGSSVFLGLLTVKSPEGKKPEDSVRNTSMQVLHRVVTESLRAGDVFSRCSGSQYIVMLPNINMENAEMVLKRISRQFKQSYHSRKVVLESHLQPLEPLETFAEGKENG